MSSTSQIFIRRHLASNAVSTCPIERTASSTVQERTFLPLALMSTWRYSAEKLARIGMGYLYNRISGLRATLARKADQIVQWVLVEADLEAERLSTMASVAARKLHRKLCR